MASKRVWIVWLIGVFGYSVAVMQRTTFGVAGVEAARHFAAPAGIIGLFVVLQLLVYALLQIPVGVLLDRFGSRLLLGTGAFVMFLGQVALAFADSVPSGVIARILVGAGDAMTFSSVLRLVPSWFPAKRAPLMTQLTGLLGQSGQIASTIPFAMVLVGAGWRPAFLAAAAVSLLAMVLTLAFVRNSPGPGRTRLPEHEAIDADLRAKLRAVWSHPGTRLGLWTHFTTCFSPIAFAMMWGFPYLTAGESLTRPQASALMTIFVVSGLVVGPTLGVLTDRHPLRRSNLAFAVVAGEVIPWIVVLLWPGAAPIWLLAILMVGVSAGGPGSAIGFDFARTFVPAHRLGTATGIVIMGGFGGALVTILLAGVVLDLGGGYDLTTFRWAMATQLPLFAIGIVGMYRSRAKVRARMAHEDGINVAPLGNAIAARFRRR
ncbi:MAG: MFS transporter [Micrococcales bacterium]|nr:MFS transporter [Micrococcales bacterium]